MVVVVPVVSVDIFAVSWLISGGLLLGCFRGGEGFSPVPSQPTSVSLF